MCSHLYDLKTRNNLSKVPIHIWECTQNLWQRLYIDFASPYKRQNFLIIMDSYSKWLQVIYMTNITAKATITQLRKLFTTHELSQSIK